MSDGKKVTREALEDKLQQQFPRLQVTENTHLRLTWLCPYICGFGDKHNGQKRVFPNTAPLLNRHPPLHTHPTTLSLIRGIKKGSKHFLKSLNKVTDFLTAEHLSSWQKVMDDPSITKDNLRRAYMMAQKNIFSGKQRDIILKLLTRKTLFNNQIPHVYGENLPPWFSSVHCNECLTKRQIEVIETATHALKTCPSVTDYYASVSQALGVPISSTNLAGFFSNPIINAGPRPTLIDIQMTSTVTWLSVITLLNYKNSRIPFDENMVSSVIRSLNTIQKTYKGFDLGAVRGFFETPRPPE